MIVCTGHYFKGTYKQCFMYCNDTGNLEPTNSLCPKEFKRRVVIVYSIMRLNSIEYGVMVVEKFGAISIHRLNLP